MVPCIGMIYCAEFEGIFEILQKIPYVSTIYGMFLFKLAQYTPDIF